MAGSVPSSWIRDYLIEVAETHGAQLYNVPPTNKRRRVQLTDFLTFQDDSYIWAWASDKEHRVSIRISKEAVEEYKRASLGRKVIESRFSVVFIDKLRPIFAPRPLGGGVQGNTPLSHLSLEVGLVKLIGTGMHQFGDPREIESDVRLKEWVAGLRQDGGGGNVLKFRKQERESAAKGPPPGPPLQQPSVLPLQSRKVAPDTIKADRSRSPKPQRSKDLMRTYQKRWRVFAMDRWKYAVKPTAEEAGEAEVGPSHLPVSRTSLAAMSPSKLPHRTPSPTPSVPQGTPSQWSISKPGTPASTKVSVPPSRGGHIDALPTDGQLIPESSVVPTSSQTHSIQPPTPAQQRRGSRSPGLSLPSSSLPPPPSSSLPTPFPVDPLDIHRVVKRRVPHPGSPPPLPDPNKSGPIQVLVPNSDASATNSSQPHSQSQSQSRALVFSSLLFDEFRPGETSTPQDASKSERPSLSSQGSQIFADLASDHRSQLSAGKLASPVSDAERMGKRPLSSPAATPPLGGSNTIAGSQSHSEESEVDQLVSQSRSTSARDDDKEDGADAHLDHETDELSDDDAETHSKLEKSTTPRRVSSMEESLVDKNTLPVRQLHSPAASDGSVSRSSMHSLFSESTDGGLCSPPPELPVGHQRHGQHHEGETVSPTKRPIDSHTPTHDPEMWREPSFMKVRDYGRPVQDGAVEQSRGVKRRRSYQPTPTPSKRMKREEAAREMAPAEEQKTQRSFATALSRASSWIFGQSRAKSQVRSPKHLEDVQSHTLKKPRQGTSSDPTVKPGSQQKKHLPRLAGFSVDFDNMEFGREHARLQLDWKHDVQSVLLRTGRIRTLGEEVERDGSVYVTQD